MSGVYSILSVSFVLTLLLQLALSRPPMYSSDLQDNDYQQMIAQLRRAKEQGYLDQLYDQLYDYKYPDSGYQDYVNEMLREQQWQDNMQQYQDYMEQQWDLPQLDFEVASWPTQKLSVGQVVGVAVDGEGHPHIFHRGERVWGDGERLFDDNHQYLAKDQGPIKEATVLMLSAEDGSVMNKWGENRFYLPHGLTIDSQGNFWVTDVALHQVLKFEPGKEEPTLVLGEAFQPATDNEDSQRFCQPTDVAVSSKGDVYVSDGYCNRRIVKFDSMGNMVGQIPLFGDENSVPHSITLAEDLDMVCVSDREAKGILCFNAGLNKPENNQLPDSFGNFEREYSDPDIGRIFGIHYNIQTGLLHAVTDGSGINGAAVGFTIDLHQLDENTAIIDEWSPFNKGFSSPHDVASSPDGLSLYVGEISPYVVWKFENQEPLEDVEEAPEESDVDESQPESEENGDDETESHSNVDESQEDSLGLGDSEGDDQGDKTEEPADESDEEKIEEEAKDQKGELELEQELEKEEQQLMEAGQGEELQQTGAEQGEEQN